MGPTPDNMNNTMKVELSSHEGTRSEFNPSKTVIKLAMGRVRPIGGLGIDVQQEIYVVVCQEGGTGFGGTRWGESDAPTTVQAVCGKRLS